MKIHRSLSQLAIWLIVAMLVSLFPSFTSAASGDSQLSLLVTPDKTTAYLGDNVTFTYVITNTGSTSVDNLTANDDKAGAVELSTTSLGPGENITAAAIYTIKSTDYPGPLTNKLTVTATTDNTSITASSTGSVELTPLKVKIDVLLSADKSTASPHEVITFTYTVTNTGDITLKDIALFDNKTGSITLDTTSLAPGNKIEATTKYTVVVGDLPGPLTNQATFKGKNPEDTEITVTSNGITITLTENKSIMTKAEILKLSGVPGKGLDKAPGLQKPFNDNSQAADHAGKKDKDKEKGKDK